VSLEVVPESIKKKATIHSHLIDGKCLGCDHSHLHLAAAAKKKNLLIARECEAIFYLFLNIWYPSDPAFD
jgi:hypothetical protein